MVDSNKEHGEGRSDVVVYDSINARVAIFEAKFTKVLENLESECDIALQQIDDRMYAKEYEDDYDQILCYGISFFKKRCMVKKKWFTATLTRIWQYNLKWAKIRSLTVDKTPKPHKRLPRVDFPEVHKWRP